MLNQVIHGDCLEVLRTMPDNSVDAVVTDPPYGLSREPDIEEVLRHWLAGDDYNHRGGGFMGKEWDSFVPGPAVWREVCRVVKPGGHILCFAGTRTVDLMGIAIRLGGFEIRDCLQWLYGSGFPKSLDVSKAIDKAAGAEREVTGQVKRRDLSRHGGEIKGDMLVGVSRGSAVIDVKDKPATEEAKQWQGWGTALKPANEPIVLARKPMSEKTIAENVLKWGTGGLNIDGCRLNTLPRKTGTKPTSDRATGTGNTLVGSSKNRQAEYDMLNKGRFPANVILDEEAGRMLDEQSGISKPRKGRTGKRGGTAWHGQKGIGTPDKIGRWPSDSGGGASRFFKNIDYTREESDWLKSQSFAFNVGKSLETMLVIIESFAPENVMQNLKKLLETSVNDAENQLKTTDIDIALRDVVILPNQEDKALNDIILHFMSEMLKALKKKDDANMRQIQNIVSKLEPELRHTLMEKLKCNPVNYADVSLLTNIMMIIQSLLTTDGCAEGVMLTTIKNSMVAGGEDYEEPTRFKYCAKASKKERNMGLEDMPEVVRNDGRDETLASGNMPHNRGNVPKKNHHPTVKPVKLMEYLITLVTPPNGIVLDPFFGSGTTGVAAVNLGFNYIGIELDEQYVEIARRRINAAGK